MYDEILSSIDNIDDCVMEAELNVLSAMCNEYDKAIMIMENYNGNDYSSFDIFQEGFKDEVNKPIFGTKGENIIKRILMFIPRLISTIIRNIGKLFNKKKDQEIIDRLQNPENPESQPKTQEQIKPGSGLSPEQTAELENLKKQKAEIVKKLDELEAAGKDDTDEYYNLYEQESKLQKIIWYFPHQPPVKKQSELGKNLKKTHDLTKGLREGIDNNNINTCLKFDKTIGYLVDYRKTLYESNKININDINSVENFVSEYSPLTHFLSNEKRVRKTIFGSVHPYSKTQAIEFITKKNSMIDDISESLNKEIKKYDQLLSNNNSNENDKNTYVYQKLLNFYQSINTSITYIGKLINSETSKWGITTSV